MLHGPSRAMEILDIDIEVIYRDFFCKKMKKILQKSNEFMMRIEMILEGLKAMETVACSDAELEKFWEYHWCAKLDDIIDYCNTQKEPFYYAFACKAYEVAQFRRNMKLRSTSREINPVVKPNHIKELCIHVATAIALLYAMSGAKAAPLDPPEIVKSYPDETKSEPDISQAEYGVSWKEPEEFPKDTRVKTVSPIAFEAGHAEVNDREDVFLEKESMENIANEVTERGLRVIKEMTHQRRGRIAAYHDTDELRKLGIGVDRHIVRIAQLDSGTTQIVRDTSGKFEIGENVALETWDDMLFFKQDHRGFLMMNVRKNLSHRNAEGLFEPFIFYDEPTPGKYANFRMAMVLPNGQSGHFSGTENISLDVKYEQEFNAILTDYFAVQKEYIEFAQRMKKEKYATENNGIHYTNDYDKACRDGKNPPPLKTSPAILKRFEGYAETLPPEVVKNFGPDRIIQSGHCNSPTLGSYHGERNLICICDEGSSKAVFFHEFFHALDANSKKNNDDLWEKRFDPENKIYGKIKGHGQRVKGFAWVYGTSNPAEDQATVSEGLFIRSEHKDILVRARTDKVLREKIETITGCNIDLKNLRYASTMTVEEYRTKTGYDGYRFFLDWSPDKINHHYWNQILARKSSLQQTNLQVNPAQFHK